MHVGVARPSWFRWLDRVPKWLPANGHPCSTGVRTKGHQAGFSIEFFIQIKCKSFQKYNSSRHTARRTVTSLMRQMMLVALSQPAT